MALGLGAISAVMAAYGGFLFTLSLHLQRDLGESVLGAGLTFAPYAAGFAATSLTAPRLPRRLLRALPPIGLLVLAAAYTALTLTVRPGQWQPALTLPLLTLAGAGFGAGFSPVLTPVLAEVPPAHAAHDASGVYNTVVQTSYTLGVATIGSYYLHTAAASHSHAFSAAGISSAGLALTAGLIANRLAAPR